MATKPSTIIIEVPVDPRSSQRIELDGDGKDFILDLKWIPTYQRFYMTIKNAAGSPILETLKIVPGAPCNLGGVSSDGPQGVFHMIGSGKITRRSFESGAYRLYYAPREDGRFPLTREYLTDTDLNTFLERFEVIEEPEPCPVNLTLPVITEV